MNVDSNYRMCNKFKVGDEVCNYITGLDGKKTLCFVFKIITSKHGFFSGKCLHTVSKYIKLGQIVNNVMDHSYYIYKSAEYSNHPYTNVFK